MINVHNRGNLNDGAVIWRQDIVTKAVNEAKNTAYSKAEQHMRNEGKYNGSPFTIGR